MTQAIEMRALMPTLPGMAMRRTPTPMQAALSRTV
jgi:hypothetical protein